MIKEYNNFLSEKECQFFIDLYCSKQNIIVKEESKKQHSLENYGTRLIFKNDFDTPVKNKATRLLDEYLAPFEMSNNFPYNHAHIALVENTGTPVHYDRELMLVNETFTYRPVVFLVYLNHDYQGGDFLLHAQKTIIKPDTGKAFIFPANFYYPHSTLPTIGKRYMLRIDFCQNNYAKFLGKKQSKIKRFFV